MFVPGLGAPRYLLPWARVTASWTAAHVLDLPGWRWGRARSSSPTLDGVADATVRWVETHTSRPVVLVGHSTGAQAALRAASRAPDLFVGVVLAGPTFDPGVRSLRAVAAAAARTVPRERPGELPGVLPSYLHSGGRPLVRFLRDALADRPEELVGEVRPPLVFLTGEHDGFAPPRWAAHLAYRAGAPHVVLPGAHNCHYPHPRAADAVLAAMTARWT
ncbi:alpha/beta fold hydrolase [Jatrophihabitans sp. YIM 134969]